MGCELWLYPSVIQRHGNELHSYKAVVIETLRKTSPDEILSICRTTRPDLDDLWKKPAARDKLKKEIERAIDAVEASRVGVASIRHRLVVSFFASSRIFLRASPVLWMYRMIALV